jgi:hypothetical protein
MPLTARSASSVWGRRAPSMDPVVTFRAKSVPRTVLSCTRAAQFVGVRSKIKRYRARGRRFHRTGGATTDGSSDRGVALVRAAGGTVAFAHQSSRRKLVAAVDSRAPPALERGGTGTRGSGRREPKCFGVFAVTFHTSGHYV